MRAIILITDSHSNISMVNSEMPACMLPLVDKPFIQHILEYLINMHLESVNFVVKGCNEQLKEFLGDGTQWGGKFSYSPVPEADHLMKTVRVLCQESHDPILLADGNYLVPAIGEGLSEEQMDSVLWMDGGNSSTDAACWTGWAVCAPTVLTYMKDSASRDELFHSLIDAGAVIKGRDNVLSVSSFERFLGAQIPVMNGWQKELVVTGARTNGGIIVGRGARIHPSAQMIGPLYIGDFSEIREDVILEAGTVVGRDCVIDRGCRIQETVVLPGTYIGMDLDLAGCLAGQGSIYNGRLGTIDKIPTDTLTGRITPESGSRRSRLVISQIVAALLLLFLWPLLTIAIIFRITAGQEDGLFRRRLLRLPAPADQGSWKYFDRYYIGDPSDNVWGKTAQLLRADLPGLLNVLRGEMHLVGSPGRTREEVNALDHEWRDLYLKSKVGLVTEARVRCGFAPPLDEQLASDSFYAVHASSDYDFKLLGDFLRMQFGPRRS